MAEFTIIFPALNEASVIVDVISDYLHYFGDRAELIIIDNGSTDNTADLITKKFGSETTVRYFYFDHALGKGGAVYAGFEKATTPLLSFTDTDGSIAPEQFEKLLERIEDIDCVIASRWIPGARMVVSQPFYRKVNGRLFNLFANALFGLKISDTQCGAKIVKRDVYEEVKKQMVLLGYSFDVEFLWRLKKAGKKITEVPIDWYHKPERSFSPFKSGFKAVVELLGLRFKRR